jgi:heptosyltransferase II
MSRILIVKLGAAGDVVRTTPVTTLFADDDIDWITAPIYAPLLTGTAARVLTDPARLSPEIYDLVVCLEEDAPALAVIFSRLRFRQVVGAYPASDGSLRYTSELRDWFDMSLISVHGSSAANLLKLANRRSYQDILFAGLGSRFDGEEYLLPCPVATGSEGDIALVDTAGGRWPNKRWGHLEALSARLARIARVRILPQRPSLLEHLGDINSHRLVVTPDSLPLHLALGLKKTTIGIFNCTSPWEIHPYGRLSRLVSPRLAEFFYVTDAVPEATLALPPDEVFAAIVSALSPPSQGMA